MTHAATSGNRPVKHPWMINAGQQDESRQNPVPDAGDVFGEMIRRRETDLREQHQGQGHAEIGRIENVLRASLADGRADENFGADGKRDGKNNRPEPFVGIKQHRAGETGNERGGKRVQEIGPAAGEPRLRGFSRVASTHSRKN